MSKKGICIQQIGSKVVVASKGLPNRTMSRARDEKIAAFTTIVTVSNLYFHFLYPQIIIIKKVLSVYTHSIYLSLSAQVAKSTFFMKSPVLY